ncbi:MAG: hypothetical protein AB8G22_21175 [Saprospiraceae bacterium]
MNFYENQLFHIYNQGNNHQQLFFNHDNYLHFIWKMRTYLLPFGDFVSYCLMPNHFHWQFYVEKVEVDREAYWQHVDGVEWQRRVWKYKNKAQEVNNQDRRKKGLKVMTINRAIGYLEMAYSRSIQQVTKLEGNVFRHHCKAKDGWIDEFITLRKPSGKLDSRFRIGTGYAHHCFHYIHQNPVAAGLVNNAEDWEYSSARDYAGMRQGTLGNWDLGRKLLAEL